MENKNERVVNVTLKNQENDKDEIIISFAAIFKMLKKFVAFWLIIAIIAGVLIPVYSALHVKKQAANLNAIVGFNYKGIEEGLDPGGNAFDVDSSIKNPAVLEAALTELNIPLTETEKIRQSISVYGIIPADAYAQITMYKNIYEEGSNLTAGEKMVAVSYHSTQYRVHINQSAAGLDDETAVRVLNTVLEKYRDFFFEEYGYNQALGSAVTGFDYSTYDYAQAMEVFQSSLNTLKTYVTTLSNRDSTRFRSTITGYTFADLSASIDTLISVDLDRVTSYISVNNVTKDKNSLIDYYNYKIETIASDRNVAQDELNQLDDAISNYEKNTVIIYNEQEAAQYAQSSAKYDDLIDRKIKAQNSVSEATQSINMYQRRLNELKSKSAASQDKVDKVEADLAALNDKINVLVDAVDKTANDYYETVGLNNAYSVQVPATVSSGGKVSSAWNAAKQPLLIAEALILVLYLAVAFVMALIKENRQKLIGESVDSAAEEKTTQVETESDSGQKDD